MLLERARASDLPLVESLLSVAGLPLDGLREAFESGVVVRDDEVVVGAAAIERYGSAGLLRSVVVVPERRGTGVGRDLVEAAERLARDEGIHELYLLTETAAAWFAHLGYAVVTRAEAAAAVGESIEFTTACPATAVAMRRVLDASG